MVCLQLHHSSFGPVRSGRCGSPRSSRRGTVTGRQVMSTVDWLLDSDLSIRWQVMRDLLDEPEVTVARERSRVAVEGWAARLLDLQGHDGHWGGASFVPDAWVSTHDTLQLLRDSVSTRRTSRMRRAIRQVRDRWTWVRSSAIRRSSKARSSPASTGECSRSAHISARPAIGSSTGYFGSNWETAAGTATPRPASDCPSTRRSACSRDCWITRRQRGKTRCHQRAPSRAEILLERRLVDRDRLERSSSRIEDGALRRGPGSRSPRDGTTTSCGGSTTCAGPAPRPMDGRQRPSLSCGRSATQTGAGLSKTRIRDRSISRWKAPPDSASRWNTLRALRVLRWADGA